MKVESYEIMNDCEASYWWYRVRREIIVDTVRRFVPLTSKVLDFGCGNGATAKSLVKCGYHVVVADQNEGARVACHSRGLRVVEIDDLEEERGDGFDCILVCDVLEHVDDDVGLLRQIRGLLRPGGLVLATVPVYEFLWSGEDYVSEHVRRYTQRTLARRLRGADLELVWDSYFNSILFPAVATVIFWNRLFRPRAMYHSNIQPLPPWLDTSLGGIFGLERHGLRHVCFPFGTSLIAIARRPNNQELGAHR